MDSQVYYRKWRPQLLSEVIGQEHVTRTLLNALANERISHAYLFCGPRGTGKTSTARTLAKAINCLSGGRGEPCNQCEMCRAITEGRALDVIEVDAASNRGIDEIRDLREKVGYAPAQARRKVYIIDEVHMLTKEASNALLKTLEEPPPHAIFILATTEVHKILPTILSRCQRFDFHRLSQADVVKKLSLICQKENISAEPEALRLIARAATGSLRDAENLLQQLATHYAGRFTLADTRSLLGISGDQRARELVKNIIDQDIPAGSATVNNVNSDGLDLRQFTREVIEYLRLLLLVKTGAGDTLEVTPDDAKELKELASRTPLQRIVNAVKRFGQLDINLDNHATLPLELAVIDSIIPDTAGTGKTMENTSPQPKTIPKAPPAPAAATNPPEKKDAVQPSPRMERPVASPKTPSAPPAASNKTNLSPPGASHPLAAGSAIQQLQQQWIKMINESPEGLSKTPAAALLRSARPVSLEGDTITISFKFLYHKEKMDNIENQKTADRIVSGFLGRACHVRCVYEHENNHLVKAALQMGAQVINTEEK